jgi:fluoride exporter
VIENGMEKLILVLIGGAVGTGCRFGISMLVAASLGPRQFPHATFIINITGSFLIGFLAQYFDTRFVVSAEIRAAVLVGILGGYTTFSSLSLETLNLIRDEAWFAALIYPLGSMVLGLVAVWSGVQLARLI